MQLDRITAVLRPRNQWEAVDLGLVLLRTFHRPVLGAWLFTVLPVCVLIFAVTAKHFWWGLFVIWLLRPMFDRVPLFVLSRALFGATPTLRESLAELPRLWTHDLWGGLVRHRLNPVRSLIMPVSELEGLRGAARGRREKLLGRGASGYTFVVGLICICFELAIVMGCLVLALLMVPEHLQAQYDWEFQAALTWELWVLRGLFLVAFATIGPLYVASGFALYINRRTHLEGWDIELGLRGIGQRLAREAASFAGKAGACLLLLALTVSMTTSEARAQEPAPAAQAAARPEQVIAEVLDHEDFTRTRTVSEWRFSEDSSGEPGALAGGLGAGLGLLIELILWGAAIALLVFITFQALKHLGWIAPAASEPAVERAAPRELFGLDLRPETIPDDVPGTAWAFWQAGDAVAALGLLYRAAISELVEGDELELTDSDTERDCLRRVRELANANRAEYFASVTASWQVCAYSTELPSDAIVSALCEGWPSSFEGAQS